MRPDCPQVEGQTSFLFLSVFLLHDVFLWCFHVDMILKTQNVSEQQSLVRSPSHRSRSLVWVKLKDRSSVFFRSVVSSYDLLGSQLHNICLMLVDLCWSSFCLWALVPTFTSEQTAAETDHWAGPVSTKKTLDQNCDFSSRLQSPTLQIFDPKFKPGFSGGSSEKYI